MSKAPVSTSVVGKILCHIGLAFVTPYDASSFIFPALLPGTHSTDAQMAVPRFAMCPVKDSLWAIAMLVKLSRYHCHSFISYIQGWQRKALNTNINVIV